MTPASIRQLLQDVAGGGVTPEDALERLRALPFSDLEDARIDHHRELRTGIPEVVFAEGKTAAQVVAIAQELLARAGAVLVTRIDEAKAKALGSVVEGLDHYADARIAMVRPAAMPDSRGHVAVVSAGTSDQGVAEEAARTLEFLGVGVRRYRDVGVAGLHRVLAERERLREASVVIVVAGMEGALPSVLGGLVDVPVIAVPTSVGYGASFGGLAALLAMMNACAPGVTVVNIDNGFGAAVAAASMLRLAARGA